MLKRKGLILGVTAALAAGLSCEGPTRPATTGSISVVLRSADGGLLAVRTSDGQLRSALRANATAAAMASVTLNSAKLIVSGPTNKTITASVPTGGNFELTATDLTPGSYSVVVEGLVGADVAYFGLTTGVSVVAGATAQASVTFQSFQLDAAQVAVPDSVDVLHFTATFAAVPNATGYIVTWSKSPSMTSPTSQTVNNTTADITVPDESNYYVTVKAVNAAVPTGGLASAPVVVFAFQGVATVTLSPLSTTIPVGGTQQYTATAKDADGNTVSGVTWLWLSDNQMVATINPLSGLATGVGNGTVNITAVGKGTPGSTGLTVNPAVLAATKLGFFVQPTATVAGQTIATVKVAIQSAQGQTVTTDNGTQVVLSILNNAGGGTLSGTTTATASGGIVTFSDLSLDKSGTSYTLKAVANGLTDGASGGFDISAAAATKLAFSVQPTNSVAGDALSPAVQVDVQDQFGNRVTSARDPITIAIANNPGSGALTGTKIVNAINGTASFTGVWINKTGAGYTFAASSGGLTGVNSTGFDISPAAPAKLAFVQQPANAQGNTSIAPAVTVKITDQFDNATTATLPVTMSIGDNFWKSALATGGSISGTIPVTSAAGTATFSDLKIDKPASGYTLFASSGTLTPGSSSAFNVNLTFTQIGGGGSQTCGVTAAATYCWGNNSNGQLAATTQSVARDSIPALVKGGLTFTAVTAGGNHSCGITATNDAYCWGYNFYGQLGNGSNTTTGPTGVPQLVSGGHKFASIDAGEIHTCGITTASVTAAEDRQVYCWGYNYYGELGNSATLYSSPGTDSNIPVRVSEPLQTTTRAAQISAGGYHTCVVALNTNAYCWGRGSEGQIGDDVTTDDKNAPTLVAGANTFLSITAGYYHTCGIVSIPTDTPARCWGYNYYGQLGDNTVLTGGTGGINQPTPVAVFANLNYSTISAGLYYTCAVAVGGAGYCWGRNDSGQLGDDLLGTNTSQRSAVAGGLTFIAIQSGYSHACGRTASGVYCWGSNSSGQGGTPGVGVNKRVPVQIVQ